MLLQYNISLTGRPLKGNKKKVYAGRRGLWEALDRPISHRVTAASMTHASAMFAGLPARLAMQPQPDWFNESEAVTLANHSTVPEFTLQLLDAAGLKTTPFAQGDR